MALCRQNKLMAYGLMALPPEPARSDSKYFPKIEVPARTAGCSVTPSGCFLLSAGPVAGAAAQATGCVFPGSGQGAGRPESWTLPLAPPGRPARRRLARTDSQRTADTDNQPARRRAESQGRRMNPLRPGRVRSVSWMDGWIPDARATCRRWSDPPRRRSPAVPRPAAPEHPYVRAIPGIHCAQRRRKARPPWHTVPDCGLQPGMRICRTRAFVQRATSAPGARRHVSRS